MINQTQHNRWNYMPICKSWMSCQEHRQDIDYIDATHPSGHWMLTSTANQQVNCCIDAWVVCLFVWCGVKNRTWESPFDGIVIVVLSKHQTQTSPTFGQGTGTKWKSNWYLTRTQSLNSNIHVHYSLHQHQKSINSLLLSARPLLQYPLSHFTNNKNGVSVWVHSTSYWWKWK
jgi:hypothetical protein